MLKSLKTPEIIFYLCFVLGLQEVRCLVALVIPATCCHAVPIITGVLPSGIVNPSQL